MAWTMQEKLDWIRSPKRPNVDDIIAGVFTDFVELHGDRLYGEDRAMCGGIAKLGDTPVTVLGQRRGHSTKENIEDNFAMAHPEGYRKALRLAKQAEKFHRPVICIVDTPGAFCGVGAEERGQGEAIARCLYEFMQLKTPVVSIVTGEGGSGGALALAVANEVYMLTNAIYSVISPRGCASILWKDASRELEAAEALKITAQDMLGFGLIDGIIADSKLENMLYRHIRTTLLESLARLSEHTDEQLAQMRYEKFRVYGVFEQ
ncbi:MAG: acetyl-CoA carboxylase carboxyl transferase subunit alpha [Eubacteriales bacterium]|nr:acetyl-CoA carboxylase carboxyl transferase subunit alpha [Eubacteriales bacterium]